MHKTASEIPAPSAISISMQENDNNKHSSPMFDTNTNPWLSPRSKASKSRQVAHVKSVDAVLNDVMLDTTWYSDHKAHAEASVPTLPAKNNAPSLSIPLPKLDFSKLPTAFELGNINPVDTSITIPSNTTADTSSAQVQQQNLQAAQKRRMRVQALFQMKNEWLNFAVFVKVSHLTPDQVNNSVLCNIFQEKMTP